MILRRSSKGNNMQETIYVYGAGLAGCEAAWQIAERGIRVKLFEMKKKFKPLSFRELSGKEEDRSEK